MNGVWVRDPDAVVCVRGRGGRGRNRGRKRGGSTDVAAISGPGDMSLRIEGDDDVRRPDVEVLCTFARGGGGGRRGRRGEDGPGAGDRDGGGDGTGWCRGGRWRWGPCGEGRDVPLGGEVGEGGREGQAEEAEEEEEEGIHCFSALKLVVVVKFL